MVLERAEITIKPGMDEEAIAALQHQGLALPRTYSGCRSFCALRCVEHPDRIMFLAEWDSIEAHQASRLEPDHIAFRQLILPFAAGAAETVHFADIEPSQPGENA